MIKEIQLQLTPEDAASDDVVNRTVRQSLSLKSTSTIQYEILKKSIDARKKQVLILLKLNVFIDEAKLPKRVIEFKENNVTNAKEIHIVGAGPAGLFCALQCIELGLKPVVFERGKNVKDRRRDLALLNKQGILSEESNYCFGEGGAGTYSDGKLYTRSNKRGNVQRILDLFYYFGADERILYEAHPHIGTNKLPHIIESIREKIIECGGEIHFNSKVTDIEIKNDSIATVSINHSTKISVNQLILATGHSANDVYELLHSKRIELESKSFALGVRIEHPQGIIDSIQYHCDARGNYLPPASYSLVEQVNGRGVFSFCMCPGGIIAPASTSQGSLVVNGWSPSKRNNPFANSGMVVSVNPADYPNQSVLGGLNYQHQIEVKAFEVGGGKFVAPAQRMTDFVNHKSSSSLPICSYKPGLQSSNLSDVLPSPIYDSLAAAFLRFGKKMRGYYTQDAIVVATESRTSSPVRIPRNTETLQHIRIKNLYPCAEGAGYAGGIVSAAMDGMNIAEKFKEHS